MTYKVKSLMTGDHVTKHIKVYNDALTLAKELAIAHKTSYSIINEADKAVLCIAYVEKEYSPYFIVATSGVLDNDGETHAGI